jgi:hypothetical protein
LRVVAATKAPRLLAMAAAASPTEVVPPRIRRRSLFFETKRLEEGAPRRLQHLRDCAERFPGKAGLDDLHLRHGHAGILRIATVELPPHAAHRGRYDVSFLKLISRRFLDQTDGLDENSGYNFGR